MTARALIPTQEALVLWRRGPNRFFIQAQTPGGARDMTGFELGIAIIGVDGQPIRSTTTDATILAWINRVIGLAALTIGKDDAARFPLGRVAQYRLWLTQGGGEAPLSYGWIIAKDWAHVV